MICVNAELLYAKSSSRVLSLLLTIGTSNWEIHGSGVVSLIRQVLLSVLFLLIPFVHVAYPWDRPFDNAANWLGTGLMEIPTARVLDDGVIRVSGAQALPLRWYGGGMGIFPGFEFTGRLTDLTNVPVAFVGQSTFRDKCFDVKYQVVPESKWLPAVALGYHDIFGTQLFEAQYIVLSRQIFPFDFTLGYGNKRLGGFFAGVEAALHPRFHFIAEYNSLDYQYGGRAPARSIPKDPDWPVNFGLRYKLLPVLDLGVSYQRGDTLGVSLNFQADLGKPIVPHRADPPPLVDVDRRPFEQRDAKEMVEQIHTAIHQAGFTNVSVYTEGRTLTAEFTNNQYLSNQKAVGRVLRILLLHAPSDAKKLQAVEKRKGMPILRVAVKPNVLEAYLMGDVPDEIFERLVEVETTMAEPDLRDPGLVYAGGQDSRIGWGVKPEFQSYLNDPSGFFKFRVGLKPWGVADLWKGGDVYARFDVPFYSNIESTNVPPPNTVREDSWKYLGRDYTFSNLLFDQALQFTDRTFGRVSFGYLEYMYAGSSGEVLHFFGDGSIAVGLQADWVRKREPGSTMALKDLDFYDVLANAYFRVPKLDVTLQAQYGRFMAGDVGWLFTGSREYDTGIIIGGWWSFTDTDDLQGFSKGYDSKGVFITLPARIFLTHDSPVRYNYSLAPWTRDAAQTPYHWQTLFDLAGDLMPGRFKAKLSDIRQ